MAGHVCEQLADVGINVQVRLPLLLCPLLLCTLCMRPRVCLTRRGGPQRDRSVHERALRKVVALVPAMLETVFKLEKGTNGLEHCLGALIAASEVREPHKAALRASVSVPPLGVPPLSVPPLSVPSACVD